MRTPHGDIDRWPDPDSSSARRSVFAQDLVVEGDVTSKGPVDVQGKIVGSLRAQDVAVAGYRTCFRGCKISNALNIK